MGAPCSCKVGSIGPAGPLLVNIYQTTRRIVSGDSNSHSHPNHSLKSEARRFIYLLCSFSLILFGLFYLFLYLSWCP
jgi:hypothetical protein